MVSGSTPALGRSVPRLAGRLLERMRPLAGRNKPCRARGAPDGTRGGRTPRNRFVAKPRLFMKYSLVAVLILLVLAVSASAQDHGGLIGADAPAGKPYIYKQSVGEPREMEIFFPPNHDPAKSRAPSLILFHGGNWVGGSLAQFRVACAYFASRGMVCATANYRMLTKDEVKKLPPGESRKRVCATDAKSAIRWFKQQARELGFNPERLVVGGASAGGHISALATLNPKLNDPSDPEDLEIRPVAFLWFNPAFSPEDANDPEIDVQCHLASDLPPTLVFFGDKDSWKKGSDAVHAKMRSMDINTVELQLTPGQDHGFFNKDPFQTTTLIAADRFLTRLGLLNGEPTIQSNPLIQ
jgi:acetyl esterase